MKKPNEFTGCIAGWPGMRTLWLIVLALLVISPATYAADTKTYSIGVVPQYEIRHLRKIWIPILNELEKETGYRLVFKGSPTIPDFEKEFSDGSYDFAYMNPYHALIANKTQGYVPLMRDTGRMLQGILVVNRDSPYQAIQDLEGKKIAFPAPNALGASLLIRSELKEKYNININPVYVKTHSSVYLNVVVNQTDAGGGVQKTLNQQKEKIRGNLRILYRTGKIAPHPIVVHPRVPEEVRNTIIKGLVEISKTPVGKDLLSKIPIRKLGAASMDDYTPLYSLNLDKYYVE